MKIVINTCYGSFGFSEGFQKVYPPARSIWSIERSDPDLIVALESYGLDAASSDMAHLKIVEIPDRATDWTINDYDGLESIIAVVDGKLCYY